jgi:glycosidase
MPELNYDNPAVKEEMLNVAKYWMDLGVDGFRFDAVKYIYYEDHTKSPQFYNWYTGELRKLNPDIYLIGECWDDQGTILKYYSAMNCFNFPMAGNTSLASAAKGTGNMSTFVDGVVGMQNAINRVNPNGMLSMFLSNHDQDRSAGFIASDNQKKMAASLYLLTPGTPVIYYGEEIGLKGSGDAPEDANRRLPFKWGDDWTCKVPNGATYGTNLWDNTADDQRKDSDSLLNHYIDVLAIRHKYPAIARGTYSAIYAGKVTFGGFQISYQGEKMIILHNTSSTETVTIDLKSLSALSGYTSFELLDFVGVDSASINGTTLTLGPQTTVIFK